MWVVGWGCQHPLQPSSSPRAGGGAHGAAPLAPSSAKPAPAALQAFNIDLDPRAPVARVLPSMALSQPPTPVLLLPGPSAQLCPQDWGAVSPPSGLRTSASGGYCSGVSLRVGISPSLAASLPHQPEARCQCFLLPGLGLGPWASSETPGGTALWVSPRQRAPVAGKELIWAEMTAGTSCPPVMTEGQAHEDPAPGAHGDISGVCPWVAPLTHLQALWAPSLLFSRITF